MGKGKGECTELGREALRTLLADRRRLLNATRTVCVNFSIGSPPDTPQTGRFTRQRGAVDVGGVLREIDDARAEESARRVRMGV